MSRKRGKLSREEMDFIHQNISTLDISQIAIQLNRSEATVQKYAKAHNLTYKGMSEEKYDDTILLNKLEERPYYDEVLKQFTDEELNYFRITWVRIIKQFREDVLYTEELEIKQWITLDILANRCMKDRKHQIEQVDRLQKLLDDLYDVPVEMRDMEQITALETELAMVRNAIGSYTTEHAKILDKIKDITKSLKAARDQRIKRIEDSKSSWAGFIRALEDEELRARVGEDAEIMVMAKEAAKERLSKYHTYEDGGVDQPFLVPEGVIDEDTNPKFNSDGHDVASAID